MQPLLDRAALVVDDGERIGLIGRNGTGKSSLLAILDGTADLDDGEVKRRDGLRTVLVEQEPTLPPASSLRESLVLRGSLAALASDNARRARALAHRGAARGVPASIRAERGDRPCVRLGRRAQARGSRARVRAVARPHAARRAHEPSRPRRHRSPGRPAAQAARLDRDHARPHVPRPGDHANRGARPRTVALVSRQFRGLRSAQGGRAFGGRASPIANSMPSGSRRRRGFAKAWRLGERATWVACAGWISFAPSAPSGATACATSR